MEGESKNNYNDAEEVLELPPLPDSVEDSKEEERRPSRRKKFLKEVIGLVLIGILVAIFRSVAFEPFKIPTGSMIPSLKIGDFIIVNKFAYGLKLPFSDVTFGGMNLSPIYLFGEKTIQRGDVVVFKYPKDPTINYIKRVIGLPGETIEIRNKIVYINDKELVREQVDGQEFMMDMDHKFKDNNLSFYKVSLENKVFYYQVDKDNFFKVNYKKRTIPPNHYFVMGDNRDFSYDSRYWGVVPHEYIKGKATHIWMSISTPDNGSGDVQIRSERIGLKIY